MVTKSQSLKEVDQIINRFDKMNDPFDIRDVFLALYSIDRSGRSENERRKINCKISAFEFQSGGDSLSTWGKYFKEFMSGTREDGTPVYCPDASYLAPICTKQWETQALSLEHPVLVARYADLCWEFSSLSGRPMNPRMARIAIDAYGKCASDKICSCFLSRLNGAARAFDIACEINDSKRKNKIRDILIQLQREAVEKGRGWWIVFEKLVNNRKSNITKKQEENLVSGLETLFERYSCMENRESVNPHFAKETAKKLISYYKRKHRHKDVKRVSISTAKFFEQIATISEPSVAIDALRYAEKMYRRSGDASSGNRTRHLMENKSREYVVEIAETPLKLILPNKEIVRYCNALIYPDLELTFFHFTSEFLVRRKKVENSLKEIEKRTVLSKISRKAVLATEGRTAATIDIIKNDFEGRLIDHVGLYRLTQIPQMCDVLNLIHEKHAPDLDDFTNWINRLGIFSDTTMLKEGIAAWISGDQYKAVHLLVPQVECGLRGVVRQIEQPVTKPHSKFLDSDVAISMGEFLHNDYIRGHIGDDLAFHFISQYTDPRGLNLRNDLAHGLIDPKHITEDIVNSVVHSLMIFGCWMDLVVFGNILNAHDYQSIEEYEAQNMSKRKVSRTTVEGYTNSNNQIVMGKGSSRHLYRLKCKRCNHNYETKGANIRSRKCPICDGNRTRGT